MILRRYVVEMKHTFPGARAEPRVLAGRFFTRAGARDAASFMVNVFGPWAEFTVRKVAKDEDLRS